MTYVGIDKTRVMRFDLTEAAKAYGNGWKLFDTPEQLADPENSVLTSEMVTIYNSLADKPVSKFSDRKTAAQRTWAIINEKVPVTDPPERTTMTDNEKNEAAANAIKTAAQQKAEMKAAKDAARAAKAQERADAKAAKAQERADKKTAAAAAKVAKQSSSGSKGRTSALSGKLLKHSVAVDAEGVVKNPRRPDSHGYRSLQIIIDAGKDGITTEAFTKAGGRMNDLHWDIDHGNVAVSDAPKIEEVNTEAVNA